MPIIKALNKLSRLRTWLFLYGTRLVECINALLIIGFSSAFLIDLSDGVADMYRLQSYQDFERLSAFSWALFLLFGVCQFIAMSCQSRRSSKASALLLMSSGAVWAIVAGTFVTSHSGMVTTAPYIYSVFSLFCCLAGYELMIKNKADDDGGE